MVVLRLAGIVQVLSLTLKGYKPNIGKLFIVFILITILLSEKIDNNNNNIVFKKLNDIKFQIKLGKDVQKNALFNIKCF